MEILKRRDVIVVDANPVLSALIKGAASRVFWAPMMNRFATTEFTITEVEKYIPRLAQKAGLREELLVLDLSLLPLTVYPRSFYEDFIECGMQRIGMRDCRDIDILALSLKLQVPLWTNDKDFEGTGIDLFSTAYLLKILESSL